MCGLVLNSFLKIIIPLRLYFVTIALVQQDMLAAAYAEQNQAQRYLRYYAALMDCFALDQLATWLPYIVRSDCPNYSFCPKIVRL